jgi:two-component system, NarL family, response regulator DegU
MGTIKIMVVDPQVFFRLGLSQSLAALPDFQLFESDVNAGLLSKIETEMIDVILLGAGQPAEKGCEFCREISRRFPATKVVVLSSNPNDGELFEFMKASAVAYLDKNTPVQKIEDTCRRAAHGEYPINESLVTSPEVAGNVLRQFETSAVAIDGMASQLTKRETQILNFIAGGNSNKKIAGQLDLSEQTIKNHISSILRKMNANDRAHAVVLAIKQGWISVEKETVLTAR